MSCIFVCEMSANHLGSLERAKLIVRAAAAAGADAVKLQTFTPEQMVEPGTRFMAGPWAGRDALELYRETHTPRAWHEPLFELAHELGLLAFSSVFHPDDVDFLEDLGCPFYKISSFELTDLTLITYAARTGKPLILSTGMANAQEIEDAVVAARPRLPCGDHTLLKCTSAYPARPVDINLAAGPKMAERYGVRWGLSDHTEGIGVAIAAAAMGASMVEKHLTLARADGGPDAFFSMEPAEFAQMVREARRAAQAVGRTHYELPQAELGYRDLRRRPGGKRGSP